MAPLKLSHLKAVLFDLDDVLVFSESTHRKAWQLSLPHFGVDLQKIDFEALVGIADREQARRFKEQFQLQVNPELIFKAKREEFVKLIKDGLESPLGRNALLDKLAKTYRLGIVSSNIRIMIDAILASEKIASFFQFIISYEDCIRHKPDPYPYQIALEKVGVAPHEALVIEDSLSGITAAQKAAIPVVGILKNQRMDQLVKGISYFNDFSEIQNIIFSDVA